MNRKLQICVQTGDWYDDFFGAEAGADAAFAFIKNLGFEALDYNLDHVLTPKQIMQGEKSAFLDQSIEQILEYYRPVKEASEKHGVSLAMAHAPFPMNSEEHPEMDDYMVNSVIKLLAVCQYLQIPALVVHPIVNKDRAKEWELNMQMYPKLIPAAKKYGVKICLENMFAFIGGHGTCRACANADEACRYIDTLNELAGEEVFGFCYDVGHANLLSCNIYEDLKTLGHRLTVLHVHENDGRLDSHCIPYTYKNGVTCTTDWEAFLKGLKEIGYTGPLNFEIFAAVKNVPLEIATELLKLVCGVGNYFRNRLLG